MTQLPQRPLPELTTKHSRYLEVSADTDFGIGVKLGEQLGHAVRCRLHENRALHAMSWDRHLQQARQYLGHAEAAFPHLVNELQGYAAGAGVSFEELWLLNLRDDVFGKEARRSASLVSSGGQLSGHTEDCASSEGSPFVLRRNLRGKSKLELHYAGTWGGNAWSVNRASWVQMVNPLRHRDQQHGVPRDLVARLLSDAEDPMTAKRQLRGMRHSAGQSFTWHRLASGSASWNLELSAQHTDYRVVRTPFAHTNHYLGSLRSGDFGLSLESKRRLSQARRHCLPQMSASQMQDVLSIGNGCGTGKLFNSSTVARIVTALGVAWVWLRSERHRGWVPYDLDFTYA